MLRRRLLNLMGRPAGKKAYALLAKGLREAKLVALAKLSRNARELDGLSLPLACRQWRPVFVVTPDNHGWAVL
jgi:hypothetical protein